MAVESARLKEIFIAALDQPDRAARDIWLDEACGDNHELRGRVDLLLAAHDRPATAFAKPWAEIAGAGENAAASLSLEKPGQVIAGRYKLLEQVGSGGMGSVWVADQIEPVRRRVAVKLIKAGMDSASVLARFEAERQALALMDHPHIARVLDGGMTEAGRPFFVMDLVKGLPITRYCDENRLSIEERLKLFIPVCQAVQHAHQKGIIHRDLKPSNILVCLYDGQPVPKVIDFGLAKAIHQPLGPATVYTSLGVMLGTPLYMSPEQAEVNNLDVDTRSDVYALGVLLYELLTGSTPLERARFEEAAWQEMMRLIREEDPPRPSLRLTSSGTLPAVAAQRHVEPEKLTRQLRGELDWIVMKCLEKDRARRYDSASGLASDVSHFLADEVVIARPPSSWYRWRKFFRRNRGRVIAVGLVLTALVAGVLGTSLALLEARAQRAQADRRLAQVERANTILGAVFADLNPDAEDFGDEPLQAVLAQRLDEAAAELDGDLVGDPIAVARLRFLLGRSWLGLGFPEKAGQQLEQALANFREGLGPTDPATLRCQFDLARSQENAGRHDEALPQFEEVFRARLATLGPDHRDTLSAQSALASHHLAAGRVAEAMPMLAEAHEHRRRVLGEEDPDTITSLGGLALGHLKSNQYATAAPLLEETLRLQRRVRGPDHPQTLTALNNLAVCFQDLGRVPESLSMLEEVLQRQTARVGANHPSTLAALNNLASAHRRCGQLDRSIPLFEDLLRQKARVLGATHPGTLLTAANLAINYVQAKRPADALPLFQRAFDGSKASPSLQWVEPHLAECLVAIGQRDEAIRLLLELAREARAMLPAESAGLGARLAQLGWFLIVCDLNAWDESEAVLREALAIRTQVEPDAWTTFSTRAILGQALLGQADHAAAEPLLVEGVEGMLAREATIPVIARGRLHDAMRQLVELYTALEKPAEAERWKSRLEEVANAGR